MSNPVSTPMSTPVVWDPDRYLRYGDERGRPFGDLLARVGAPAPRRVLDLGCGPGGLTASLAERWPSAEVIGLDASAAMVQAAAEHAGDRVRFVLGDVAGLDPHGAAALFAGAGAAGAGGAGADPAADAPGLALPDVVVSNAALQWVPGHRALLPTLLGCVAPGGWFAFQVPGNFGEPSHRLLHELAGRAPYAEYVDSPDLRAERPASAEPDEYLTDLATLGCVVDAWETTYLHVLSGPDPVFGWISGTGARPVLQRLPDDLRPRFETEYKAALAAAYPERSFGTHPERASGTVLPFRRIFVVARTPEAPPGRARPTPDPQPH